MAATRPAQAQVQVSYAKLLKLLGVYLPAQWRGGAILADIIPIR
jgi:hypothetical protein